MTVAVTGATGPLGRLAIEELLRTQQPSSVVAIARDPGKAAALSALGVQVRIASYDDPAALTEALRGVDRLLLVSGNEVGRRVVQHGNVLAAAETAGVTFLVYTSATKATTSALVLAPEHKATEELLGGSHLAHAIVRNNWYTENYAVQLETARQTGTVVAAVGEGRVASASRADYASGAVAALLGEGHAGRVYELSGDVAWDYEELAATIGRVLGRPVSYRSVDADTLVAELTAAGVDQGSAGFVAALDTNIADGLLAETSGELAALIGRPTTPLYDGLLLA